MRNVLRIEALRLGGTSNIFVQPVPISGSFNADVREMTRSNALRDASNNRSNNASGATLSTCHDSTYKKLITSGTLTYALPSSCQLKDGGILMGGFGRNLPDPPPYLFYGMLVKIDSNGNFVWAEELRANSNDELNIQAIQELSDGSIIISGGFNNRNVSGFIDAFVAKLNANGSLIWAQTFQSLTFVCGSGDTNFFPLQIAEGDNGNLFVAGFVTNCSIPRYAVLFKLSASGTLLWSDAFNDGEGFGVTYSNNALKFFCRAGPGDDNVVHIDILHIDPLTGSLLFYQSWAVNTPYPESFWVSFSNQLYVKLLPGGNYYIYGELYGDYTPIAGVSHHVGVLEFTASDLFVNGYEVASPLPANADGSTSINIDETGHLVFSLFVNYTGGSLDIFMASIDKGNILKLRRRHYANNYFFDHDAWAIYDDRSYAFLKILSDNDNTNWRIEFSRLHDTDTSSLCLGIDTNFCQVISTPYVLYNMTIPPVITPAFIGSTNNGMIINPEFHIPGLACTQINHCDTLKIHGTAVSCSITSDFLYTSYKNPGCGSWVTWAIDTSAVSFFQAINDSTVRVHFRTGWQGYLYAAIPTSCGVVKDSILLSFSDAAGPVQLGPDSTICPGNSILLNAHSGYISYLWQDGSSDSIFLVTDPGIYFVQAQDACGGVYNDTVLIDPRALIPFSIGPDRVKCNNDTLHLDVPSGFLNYTWGPFYNITTISQPNVVINPAMDTSYFVRVEQSAGCFAYDTIHISVYHSPPITLGNDKSFCQGDSAVLDAGMGFSQYLWSNSSTSPQLTVYATGDYSVIGTTAQNCLSYDTLRIINVWTNPIVNLDHNPSLCDGDSRTLNAGNFSSYLWQDGNSSPSFTVSATGTYYVTVWDNHQCRGSDTVIISSILPLPTAFLPADTSICNYGKLVIEPKDNFSTYLWNNNASSSSISVTVPGTYWLQVKDVNNCVGRDSILVSPKDCLTGFYIPNAFTPDNNGRNDDFKPFIGGTVKQYEFTIYNRWGQMVFTTKDIYKGWDGTLAGTRQDTNVFAWICKYQLEGQEVILKKGVVVLIR